MIEGIRRDSRGSYSFVCHLHDLPNNERSARSVRSRTVRSENSPPHSPMGENVTRAFDRVADLISENQSKKVTDLAAFLSIGVEAAERVLSEHGGDVESAAITVLTETKNEGLHEDGSDSKDTPTDPVDAGSGGFCAVGNGRACPVCFDRYDSAQKPCVALDDCGHTMCGSCLWRMTVVALENQFGKRASKYVGSISDFAKNGRHKLACTVSCPTCRNEATGWLKIYLA